ncbi:MAG: alpha-L-rhamnosidase [Chitinophagaceae bacterium]|nr:MAG: alpha-L-rhamnosidase [Chitinophagaceae bacterium]
MKGLAILIVLAMILKWNTTTAQKADREFVREYILPERIVVMSDSNNFRNWRYLVSESPNQISFENRNYATITGSKKGSYIILDYGREIQGGILLSCASTGSGRPEKLRISFGESVGETMSEPYDSISGGSTNDHAIRDDVHLIPNMGTTEFGNTGFRFVRISVPDSAALLRIQNIKAVSVYRDLPYRGYFRSSDKRIDSIWMTGAYTVQLNMQDYLIEGIKRDRLVWIGDIFPEIKTMHAVFGSHPIAARSLDLIKNETPVGRWMNGIPSYSLWWMISQREIFLQKGDTAYLKTQLPYLAGLTAELRKYIAVNGSEKLPGWRFLDWPSSQDTTAIHAGLQALLIIAMEASRDLAIAAADKQLEKLCTESITLLKTHKPAPGKVKQAAALMALGGLYTAAEINRNVLAVEPLSGISSFYGYFILQARAKAGDYKGGLELVRKYWGAMLDLGATSFWEDFDLAWMKDAARIDEITPAGKVDVHKTYGAYSYKAYRHSLCHGWASGPTAWLSEHVLGVTVMEAGGRTVKVEPHLGDLEWIEGGYPTPFGVVEVKVKKLPNGSLDTRVKAPKGVKVIM